MTARREGQGYACAPLFFAMIALLFVVFVFKDQLSMPPKVAETKAITGFDANRAVARLSRILGDQRSHRVDTVANDAVRERLLVELATLGLKPEVRDDFACRSARRWGAVGCARVRNVIVRMGPAGGNAVLVAAHYDSVAAGPGAADDGAGVASLLEIAAQLRGRQLSKPVILLFSDGEEAGLLGAASFVRRDPYAKDVAFAINLEARGTGGPAIMFQTSTPNSVAVYAFARSATRPVANSLAADIYRTLPNDTDATEFLGRGYEVLNFAFIEPLARYHSPLDTLKWLDHDSVGHLGSSGLKAVEGYLAQPNSSSKARDNVIYTDILGRALLVMPTMAGVLLLGFGLVASLAVFVRAGGGRTVRALLTPLVCVLVASGFCFAATAIVGALNVENLWWYSVPRAAVAVIAAASVLGVVLALVMLARGVAVNRLIAAGWVWLFSLAALGGFFSTGSLILTAPAAGVFGLCWLLTLWRPTLPAIIWLAPVIALLGIILPTLSFAGAALGYGLAWAVAGLAALLFLPALAVFFRAEQVGWRNVALPGVALVGAIAWAAAAPAYTETTPAPLNIQHWESAGPAANWVLSPDREPVPPALLKLAPFMKRAVPGNSDPRMAAPAAPIGGPLPEVKILSDRLVDGKRQVELEISAVGSDEIQVVAPEKAALTAVTIGAETFPFDAADSKVFRCVGRSCSTWRLTVTVKPGVNQWFARTLRYGLDASGQPLQKARPANAMPNQNGDVRVATRTFSL